MRPKLGIALCVLALALVGGSELMAARLDTNENAVFSIAVNQFGTTTPGGFTLLQHGVYHSDHGIVPFTPQFV